jgi:hypothetical protein
MELVSLVPFLVNEATTVQQPTLPAWAVVPASGTVTGAGGPTIMLVTGSLPWPPGRRRWR